MFDETNMTQEQEISLPEKLFESEDSYEEEILDQNHDEEEKQTITIKYNGEERDISLDEARVLAQKGMNYDHVVAERDTKYKRELDFLDKVAEKRGLTRAKYMEMHEEGLLENKNENPIQEVSGRERAAMQVKRITDSLNINGPWTRLFNKYPTLSRKDAYSSLSDAVAKGSTPIEAYQEKLIAEKEMELRSANENRFAERKSTGSIEGDGSGAGRDEFLEGFSMYN